MAKVEDLIAQVADQRLQQALRDEVKALKRTVSFGLVFEDHLPETVRFPGLPIKEGELVVLKTGSDTDLLRVRRMKRRAAVCSRTGQEKSPTTEVEVPLKDLVVIRRFGDAIYPSLVPIDRVMRGKKTDPWHCLINADNFHALELLLYTHERAVDVIYIDPPYNSGARDWKYNNDYVDKTDTFRHSKWLSMIRRRLLLAKRLLKPDGVLIITIDENEVYHLGMLLEHMFGDYQRHSISIVINPKGTGQVNFGRTAEYALFCVPPSKTALISANQIPDLAAAVEDLEEEETDDEDAEDDEEIEEETSVDTPYPPDEETWDRPFPREEADQWELRHARRRGNESSYRHQRKNQFYPIYIDEKTRRVVEVGDTLPWPEEPSDRKKGSLTPIWPIDKEGNQRCWRFIPQSMRRVLENGRLVVGRYDQALKSWTLNVWYPKSTQKRVKTVWWHTRHDAGTHGTTMLHQILGRRDAFPFPKSLYAVRDTLLTVIGNRPNAVVLDFFAGSGTTAHAVALINAQLGGSRRTILVSNNEPGEKRSKILEKAGHAPGDEAYEAEGICESVTWPRCRNVINGKRDDGKALQGQYLDLANHPKQLKLATGFTENLEYFRLTFIDPSEVARGDGFQAILPILWLMTGGIGAREVSKGSTPWFLPKNSPFAVLLKEKAFRSFREKLADRTDVTHVFLVTDSEENFASMRRALSRKYVTTQLYKSYLENFRINTSETIRHAHEG